MTNISVIHTGAAWALALLPALYVLCALAVPALQQPRRMWRVAIGAAGAGAGLSALALIGVLVSGVSTVPLWPLAEGYSGILGIRVDSLTVIMTTLVSFIAWVILRFARQYLAGESDQDRFLRYFFATVASVSLLVVTDHLLALAIGWVAASLSLHQLLIFYPGRTQAALAAHKKFLLSRLADICLLTAFALIGNHYGSFQLETIFAAVDSAGAGLPPSVAAATVMVAVAMILKCAQLPFHGWLIQVMEAPTPVSALLHAGVVNIGGFLLIRLAPVMSLSVSAQWLLVVVGAMTAVVAGLVMMTRISVKVMLAWSTCAQMGFMLLECGLGAYSLALLHLVAHSLYKAHCFLGSGDAVAACTARKMAAGPKHHSVATWAMALVIGVGSVGAAALLMGADVAREPAIVALAGIVGVGVTTMIGESLAVRNGRVTLLMLLGGFAVGLLYFTWHGLIVSYAGLPLPAVDPYPGMVAFVLILFALQLLTYAASRVAPYHPAMVRLHAYLYHGMYLDELFTRVTFVLWPPRLTRFQANEEFLPTIPDPAKEGART